MTDFKIKDLISRLHAENDLGLLENLGRELSTSQFQALLDEMTESPALIKKLSPLLVGLPSPIFIQSLDQMTASQLEVVKQGSIEEPLLHQILLFIHTMENLLLSLKEEVAAKTCFIQALDPLLLSSEELENIEKNIREIKQKAKEPLPAMVNAHLILWNTGQIDLIDRLSCLKDNFHHLIHETIGVQDEKPRGIYQILSTRLNTVYESPALLNDEDPSLEGLACFSIWYLKDYWFLGLLPSISADRLEIEGSENDKHIHRQALFQLVQQRLSLLGLETVGDLKKARIFSKDMLLAYLRRQT
ncbi:MAG: hypothetical protein LW832_00340 [Parachlamydia sp.]|jgi:hypothetical protein|nr:hypothetical protein [Parachlamydia sp.]